MTLIITLNTPFFTAQVVERTLSYSDGRRPAFPVRNDANKMIYVRCRDAHFSMSLTGLAVVPHLGQPIDLTRLLANEMEKGELWKRTLEEVIDFIDRRLQTFRHPACFVFAGFRNLPVRDRFELCPLLGEVFTGEILKKIITVKKRKNTSVAIHGATHAVSVEAERIIKRWISSSQFSANDPNGVVAFLVRILRDVADTKAAAGTVGKDCITAVLQKRDSSSITCKYHPLNRSVEEHHPLLVAGMGFIPSAIMIELENGEFIHPTGEIVFFPPEVSKSDERR